MEKYRIRNFGGIIGWVEIVMNQLITNFERF